MSGLLKPKQSKSTRREPPTVLFSSRSASSVVSLPGASPAGRPVVTSHHSTKTGIVTAGPSSRDRNAFLRPTESRSTIIRSSTGPPPRTPAGGTAHANPAGTNVPPPPPLTPRLRAAESSRVTDKTDFLWAEMQATLEEVELSASGGTRVFGPEHDGKLADLRSAQIALAQAWARSEADEVVDEDLTDGVGHGLRGNEDGTTSSTIGGRAEGTAAAQIGSRNVSGSSATAARPGSSGSVGGTERLGEKLEEETEVDILMARKRREANDRYFERVNQGVLDVIAKLENVAVAMKAVEQESKEIWGESDSLAGSTKA